MDNVITQKQSNVMTSKKAMLFTIYVIITIAIYILPATKLTVPYVFSGSLMLLSFPFMMFMNNKHQMFGLILLVTSMITFLASILLHSVGLVDAINESIRNIRWFIPVFWGIYVLNCCNDKQRKFILIAFAAITVLITCKTLEALTENAWIARILAQDQSHSSAEINQYRLNNVGGYQFSYMFGVVTIALFWLMLNSKKRIVQILSALGCIVCYFYIISTMYTTLLIVTTACAVMLVFIKVKNPIFRIIFVVLSILFLFQSAYIFLLLSKMFDGSLLATKFLQISNMLAGEGIDSLGARPGLIVTALQNWIKNPIFGSPSENASHSLIFETLQSQGLFALSAWIALLAGSWKMIGECLKEQKINTDLFNISMLYLLLISIFNDTKWVFEITIVVFFIVPSISIIFGKYGYRKENGEIDD